MNDQMTVAIEVFNQWCSVRILNLNDNGDGIFYAKCEDGKGYYINLNTTQVY